MNDLAKAWLDELRSGKYPQGTGKLRDGSDAYCCLGVACELYRQTYGKGEWQWQKTEDNDFAVYAFVVDVEHLVGVLPAAVRDALGLDDSEGGYYDDGGNPKSLVNLNDAGMTFAEIADIIESEPRWLFG